MACIYMFVAWVSRSPCHDLEVVCVCAHKLMYIYRPKNHIICLRKSVSTMAYVNSYI